MKTPVSFFCMFIWAAMAQAQPQVVQTVLIPGGTRLNDVLPASALLQYPQFTQGKVFFRDGTQAEARLNYNSLFDEIHFIDGKGDTLAVADEKAIRQVTVGADTFFYDKGFVRLLRANGTVKLADRQVWVVGNNRLSGSFNTSGTTSAVASLRWHHNAAGSRYGLTVNEDVTLNKVQQYYLGDKHNHYVPATKKNLMLLFPKQQREMEQYLKQSRVDFNREEDLVNLMAFLGGG